MTPSPNELASAQHGLLTTEQLRAAGLGIKQIAWLVTSDQLLRVSPRLLKAVGSADSQAQRLLAAALDAGPGSALSHTTALAWWGVPGFPVDEIHITHRRDGVHRPCRLADHVHDVVLLPKHHVVTLEGIPIVVPARALFDVAGLRQVHPRRVERAVDNAWSQRMVSGRVLHRMLDELARRGRPGIRQMREILSDRGPDYVPPASGLEARVEEILRDYGLRPLQRQVDVSGDDGWIGRVDFVDQQLPFILEVQSERFHTSLVDQRADQDRFRRLDQAGYVVATVTDVDVWHRKAKVAEIVRRGRWDARARSAVAAAA